MAAKRFHNTGEFVKVSTTENRDLLMAEISRLQRCGEMLMEFYRYAKQCEVQVSKGTATIQPIFQIISRLILVSEFRVTSAYLAREVYDQDKPPETLSSASGRVRVSNFDPFEADDCPDGAYWLLEPMRHTSVKRYSGTMDHINREHGKDALTINAFAHFAYIYSGKEIVFADIQGMSAA